MSTYNTGFKDAVTDYRYLKNREYSDKSALKLIGDHYRLSKIQRNCLLRGIVTQNQSITRKKKLIGAKAVRNKSLGIDWYNVLITIESYLKGQLLFLADDGVIRDSSSTHGSYRQSQVTEHAVTTLGKALLDLQPQNLSIVMDSPISFSKMMADNLRTTFNAVLPMPFEITLLHSADYALKTFQGIVASSDSVIMDCVPKIFDIARYCLSVFFGFIPPSVENLHFDPSG